MTQNKLQDQILTVLGIIAPHDGAVHTCPGSAIWNLWGYRVLMGFRKRFREEARSVFIGHIRLYIYIYRLYTCLGGYDYIHYISRL